MIQNNTCTVKFRDTCSAFCTKQEVHKGIVSGTARILEAMNPVVGSGVGIPETNIPLFFNRMMVVLGVLQHTASSAAPSAVRGPLSQKPGIFWAFVCATVACSSRLSSPKLSGNCPET